jgi:ATP-dependent RNA helicase RhlE
MPARAESEACGFLFVQGSRGLALLQAHLRHSDCCAPCIGVALGCRFAISSTLHTAKTTPLSTFKDLDLIQPLQRALGEAGYQHPTEIQCKAIPEALQGRDILGCAQTGTGKTAAFVLPILDYLASQPGKAAPGKPFVLVLAPTRELAIQIGKSVSVYGKHLKLRTSVVFGGVHQSSQVRSMQRGAEILVATPGRLLDLMQQGHIALDRLEIFVLDEADRMLDMGFLPDLKRIVRCLPEERQSLFFSATLSSKITELAKSLLHEPVMVNVTPKVRSVEKIRQEMRLVVQSEKQSCLQEVLSCDSVRLAVVFTRTKRSANAVERKLRQGGFNAAAIHGNKSQTNRQRTLDSFRRGRLQVLVATDVAARGIDVQDISHVVNYDLPSDPESYVHRIGRTGRAGAGGTAITFYTRDQLRELQAIQRFAGLSVKHEGSSQQPAKQHRRERSLSARKKGRASSARRPKSNGKRREKKSAAPAT